MSKRSEKQEQKQLIMEIEYKKMVTLDLTKDGPLRHTFKYESIKKFCHNKAIQQNNR